MMSEEVIETRGKAGMKRSGGTLSAGQCMMLLVFASLFWSLFSWGVGLQVVVEGPGAQVAEITRLVWHEGSIEPQRYYDLYAYLLKESATTGRTYWQDVFSLGGQGQLFPEHCLLHSLLTVPLYGIFGDVSFWLINQLCILYIFWSLMRMSCALGGERHLGWLFFATLFGTQSIFYFYNYSYDVLGTAFIVGGFDLVRRRPLWGAFLFGLSVFVRPSHALFAPFLCFAWPPGPSKFRYYCDCVLGGLTALGLFLGSNMLLWGHPFFTAHDRMPLFSNGEVIYALAPFSNTSAGTDPRSAVLLAREIGPLRS